MAERLGFGEEADGAQPGDELGAEARLLDELVEGEAAPLGNEQPFDPGSVDVQQGLDRGEGESLGLQLSDPAEPVEVLRGVELVAARTLGHVEETLPGVVADGVDGDPGLVGELVDAPPGLGHVQNPPS